VLFVHCELKISEVERETEDIFNASFRLASFILFLHLQARPDICHSSTILSSVMTSNDTFVVILCKSTTYSFAAIPRLYWTEFLLAPKTQAIPFNLNR